MGIISQCELANSGFQDTMTFQLDGYGNAVAMRYQVREGGSNNKDCASMNADERANVFDEGVRKAVKRTKLSKGQFIPLRTTVRVNQPIDGKRPTMETVRASVQGGSEDGDQGPPEPLTPLSILKKYWVYVAGFLLMMFVTAFIDEPEEGTAGRQSGGGQQQQQQQRRD
eukprot:TRINITY_DN1362_c0_g2_i1.p1 TRINITY_DN1362_c0_g2~~TRINITY_DN1362_c0_g2_i1.p1  ORF type:complete len:169 (-),score=38.71 TRINITY_DN1362_c0_g2_i1:484-990(-)